MTHKLMLEAIKYGAACNARIEASGLRVIQVQNTEDALTRMEALRSYPVSRPLSAKLHDFTHVNSFWLFLTHEGRDVGGVCAKYIDIGPEKLNSFLQRSLQRLFFPEQEGTVNSTDISDFLDIRGKTVYLGDLYVKPEHRGTSGQSKILMHLLFILSLMEWGELDWVYSFLRNADIGRAHYYGFTSNVPTPLIWSDAKDGRSNEEYLAALPASALKHLIRTWARDVDSFVEPRANIQSPANSQKRVHV